jgi:hypothetical protein
MTKSIRIAAPLMAVALFFGASFIYAQNSQMGNGNQNTEAQQTTTVASNNPQMQQGYKDGVEAAKLDTLAHRPVDPKVSHLYVHPPVKGAAVAGYRSAFEDGYKAATKSQNGM